jgi:small subunit ribosomal protein S17e
MCVEQHLMKRISRGPVRGISLKLQEEERERRMDVVPDRSALDQDVIDIDVDTKDMLKALNINLSNVQVPQPSAGFGGDRRQNRRP